MVSSESSVQTIFWDILYSVLSSDITWQARHSTDCHKHRQTYAGTDKTYENTLNLLNEEEEEEICTY